MATYALDPFQHKMDFNFRNFYQNKKATENWNLSSNFGLPVRNSFCAYDEATGNQGLFIVNSDYSLVSQCFGLEFDGYTGYIVPFDNGTAMLFIYDKVLLETLQNISCWSYTEQKMFSNHTPILSKAIQNAMYPSYEPAVTQDENMVCFSKLIRFPLNLPLSEEDEMMLKLEIFELIAFRGECGIELASFEGFTVNEEARILMAKGANALKTVVKNLSFSDLSTLYKSIKTF